MVGISDLGPQKTFPQNFYGSGSSTIKGGTKRDLPFWGINFRENIRVSARLFAHIFYLPVYCCLCCDKDHCLLWEGCVFHIEGAAFGTTLVLRWVEGDMEWKDDCIVIGVEEEIGPWLVPNCFPTPTDWIALAIVLWVKNVAECRVSEREKFNHAGLHPG